MMADQANEAKAKADASALQAQRQQANASEQWWRQYGQSISAGTTVSSSSCGWIGGASKSVVHYFKGTDSPTKPTPCGALLAVQAEGKVPGIRLTGLVASESPDEVTCVACLRALVAKKRRGKGKR